MLDTCVAADVSRRHLGCEMNAPTDVGGYTPSVNRAEREISRLGRTWGRADRHGATTMKIGVNLTETEAKALKARLEAQLGRMCGGGWCVDVYRSGGRWLARAYRRSEHPGKPTRGRGYRKH